MHNHETGPMRLRRSAAGLFVLALVAAGCSTDPEETATDPEPSQSGSASTGAPDPTGTPSEGEIPADSVTVPVYFVGETPQGPRLYREFRQVEADNPMDEAVALLVAGDTLDPDYSTLWTPGSFAGIQLDGGVLVANLPADTTWTERGDLTAAEAELAVQQLVYTLQGIAQERAPLRAIGSDGAPAPLFGVDTSNDVVEAPELDIKAFVNVTEPAYGDTVTGTLSASGVASSFEATVPWEIRQGSVDGEVVLEGFATADGFMDKLYPWETDIDVSGLAPGEYEFVALTDDASDGEGPGPTEDSKRIVVE